MYGRFAEGMIDDLIIFTSIDQGEVIMCSRIFKQGIVTFILCILISGGLTYAGNIDPNHKCAYGENIGWVNLEPTSGPGVTVADAEVTGYAWAENVGWIKMDPEYGGVVNDGNGNLSGDAWGENTGWISFSCEDSGTCGDVEYGVTVDPCDGTFSGCAWGENTGWISFEADGPVSFEITTSWRLDTDTDGIPDCSDETPFGGTEGGSGGGSSGICFISTLINR